MKFHMEAVDAEHPRVRCIYNPGWQGEPCDAPDPYTAAVAGDGENAEWDGVGT